MVPDNPKTDHRFSLVIRFGMSKSTNYTHAVRAAAAFGDFRAATQATDVNEVTITAESFVRRLHEWQSIWHSVSYWKRSELTLNGSQVDPRTLNGYIQVAQCWLSLQKSARAEVFCRESMRDGNWGCRQLAELKRSPGSFTFGISDPKSFSCWFHFGQFAGAGVWRVDRDAIRRVLDREAESRGLWLCPDFDMTRIASEINTLPDIIDLNSDRGWRAVSAEGETVETTSPSAVGVARIVQPTNAGVIRLRLDGSSVEEGERGVSPKERNIPSVSFDDIGGIDDIVTRVREVVELPLKRPDVLLRLGIQPHRGVLLYGPPGCGKTLIARAIANEVRAHFISVSGPEILSKWFGSSESNLRRVYAEAIAMKPSIVYFDELDSIAPVRSDSEAGRLDSRIVNQLLTLMDGMSSGSNVCTIASTNRPELLDPAVLRPGRFDYKIEVGLPNYSGRLRILQIHTSRTPLAAGVSLAELARMTAGLSGAALAFVTREAAYNCLRRTCDVHALLSHPEVDDPAPLSQSVVMSDFIDAVERVKEEGDVSDSGTEREH